MPRTLDADLLAAMNSGIFTPYFKIELLAADRSTINYSTEEVTGFELDGLSAKIQFHDPTWVSSYTTFRIKRGITVAGVPNFVTSSQFYPYFDRHDKRVRTIEGHVFPNEYYSTPGHVSYHNLIDTICTAYGFGVTFADPAAAWLNYMFYPTGRTLILNTAMQFFTVLRSKYLVFATDYDEDNLFFYHAHDTAPAFPADYYSLTAGHVAFPGGGAAKNKSFLSRDENATTHTSGSADDPIHNLGYLESTDSHPARTHFVDTHDWIFQRIPPNLKHLDFDSIYASFDVGIQTIWPAKFREIFNKKLSPSWQFQARYLDIFGNTEGGAIPSSIEAAAPYTPINTSEFNYNLNSSVNNLQAFANHMDEETGGPAIYNSTAIDPPDDADVIPVVDVSLTSKAVKKFTWANLKSRLFAAFAISLGAASALTEPEDDDLFPVSDVSLATDVIKKITWSEMKIDLANDLGLEGGIYSPTLYNTTNIDASTAYGCQYMRVGDVVTVSGRVEVDPTAAATLTELGISLPIASSMTAYENLAGTCCNNTGTEYGVIQADATNDRAKMKFQSLGVANHSIWFHFTYLII